MGDWLSDQHQHLVHFSDGSRHGQDVASPTPWMEGDQVERLGFAALLSRGGINPQEVHGGSKVLRLVPPPRSPRTRGFASLKPGLTTQTPDMTSRS
jgi:hypothetical protein